MATGKGFLDGLKEAFDKEVCSVKLNVLHDSCHFYEECQALGCVMTWWAKLILVLICSGIIGAILFVIRKILECLCCYTSSNQSNNTNRTMQRPNYIKPMV